jgi:hypothetical protein
LELSRREAVGSNDGLGAASEARTKHEDSHENLSSSRNHWVVVRPNVLGLGLANRCASRWAEGRD